LDDGIPVPRDVGKVHADAEIACIASNKGNVIVKGEVKHWRRHSSLLQVPWEGLIGGEREGDGAGKRRASTLVGHLHDSALDTAMLDPKTVRHIL
jgi:hypothetical protein